MAIVRLILILKTFILALKFAVDVAIFEAAFLSPLNFSTICPHFCDVCLSIQQLIAKAIAPTARSYKKFLISNFPVHNLQTCFTAIGVTIVKNVNSLLLGTTHINAHVIMDDA